MKCQWSSAARLRLRLGGKSSFLKEHIRTWNRKIKRMSTCECVSQISMDYNNLLIKASRLRLRLRMWEVIIIPDRWNGGNCLMVNGEQRALNRWWDICCWRFGHNVLTWLHVIGMKPWCDDPQAGSLFVVIKVWVCLVTIIFLSRHKCSHWWNFLHFHSISIFVSRQRYNNIIKLLLLLKLRRNLQ